MRTCACRDLFLGSGVFLGHARPFLASNLLRLECADCNGRGGYQSKAQSKAGFLTPKLILRYLPWPPQWASKLSGAYETHAGPGVWLESHYC